MKLVILPERLKDGFRSLLRPIIRFFIVLNLNPNFLTTVSLILCFMSAYQFAKGSLRLAALLLILGGIFDMIDGSVARATNRVTRFGALYDSTLDRYAEIAIFLGIGWYFIRQYDTSSALGAIAVMGVFLGLAGSIMVSYVRARAEGLDFECKVGLMQRPERLVVISVAALISEYVLIGGLAIIALFANFTAIQRVYYIWAKENAEKWAKVSDAPHE
ncbi:CDP-alcohol phosphatidyltransferase family protein [candidate division KSB1 bacterium]|jgi:CDP-diacylglycerol--glycerol-3-phosphate 3-phosphatidyltransferase|nr:CDP-alcohol phosphatidyltransferase family protein [candidate division KSB1 bacterium]